MEMIERNNALLALMSSDWYVLVAVVIAALVAWAVAEVMM